MKKLIKWLGIGVVSLVVLVVLAALILPSVIDPNDHKARIETEITKALGRQVTFAGPLSWSVFPWVAIEAADVSVANEQGFPAAHLLSVELVSARVKLLPLISGKIEVGMVVLNEPDVNLEIAASGATNWDSLVTGSDSGADTPGADSSGAPTDLNLQVAGIQIVDAAVSYSDLSSDLKASVTRFNLTTGAVDTNSPLELDLSMQVAVDQLLDAAISARVDAAGLLKGSAPVINVSQLSVDGSYLGAGQGGLPFALSIAEPLTLDQGKGQVSAKGVQFKVGALKVLVDVAGQTGGTLAGNLAIPEVNLRDWLADALGASMEFSDPQALTKVSVNSAFSMTGNKAKLSELKVLLDETTIAGSADLSDISGLVGSFAVTIDAINVDRYMPTTGAEQSPDQDTPATTLEDLAIGQLNGSLNIGELKVAGITASNVALKMSTSPQGVTLEPMTASLYEGLLNTQVKLGPGPGSGRLSLNQTISSVQAGPLLTDLMGQQYMTGTGNLEAKLDIDDALGATPLAGANGRISFTFSDGAIFGMDVVGAIQKAASLLDPGAGADKAAEDEEPATKFSKMELVAKITNGVLTTESLVLESPLLKMGGNITINLNDMTISGLVEPTIVDPAGLGALKRFAGVPIPVRLSGQLEAPKIGIDPAKLALAGQQQKIDEKKDELLGRLLGGDKNSDAESGEEEESDSGDSKKKLLKSLFGDDDGGP